ncbi:MAG: peptidylprolyl isomerase [Candidatus Omnitrophica bacterium]|nr:peptidylprolyl isomerase [Candidatus Omnitrophota bacterium]
MILRKSLRSFVSLAVLLGFSIGLANSSHAEIMDKVLVVVNEEVVTQRDFDRIFVPIEKNFMTTYEGKELERQLETARAALLEQLINSKLTISLAKDAEVEIDEEELQSRIGKVRAYYDSEETFLQVLNAKGTNLTEFNKEIREQMLAQAFVEQEISEKIVVSPVELKDLYNKNKEKFVAAHKVKVRSIMIRKTKDREMDKAKIDGIIEELKRGRNFVDFAKEASEGPYAAEGGDMGFVSRGQVLEEMEKAIFSTKVGEVSAAIETHIGFHVFLIEEIQKPRTLSFSEVSDFLREQLYMKRFEENLVEWLKEKRENAYIAYK